MLYTYCISCQAQFYNINNMFKIILISGHLVMKTYYVTHSHAPYVTGANESYTDHVFMRDPIMNPAFPFLMTALGSF